MKRQRGRGRRTGGGNNNNPNKHFESNGPDVKIRGSAQQILDKYQQYARDAQSSGDRVNAENYLQHAEHYYRVLAAMQPKDRPRDDRSDQNAEQTNADGSNAEAGAEGSGQGEQRENNGENGRGRGRGRSRRDRGEPRGERDASANEAASGEAESVTVDADAAAPSEPVVAETVVEAAPKRRRAPRKKPTGDAAVEPVAEDGVMKTLSRGRKKAAGEPDTAAADAGEASVSEVGE